MDGILVRSCGRNKSLSENSRAARLPCRRIIINLTNLQQQREIAKALFSGNRGLLAMDESNSTCNKRFAALGIPQTEEARRAYRELIVTT